MSQQDLSSLLLKSACYCLNVNNENPISNLFEADPSLILKSDEGTDEQLLLSLAFNQSVKISKLKLGLPADESRPKSLLLFANKFNLDFAEALDTPPTQVVTLPEGSTFESIIIDLQPVKWKSVDMISLLIVDNYGAPFTSLVSLSVFGIPLNGTNVAAIHDQHNH
eukprot:gene4461-6309_t